MAYKPFLISGFQTGKMIGIEPWMLPQDAFSTLENMYVNKGVLEKRNGFSLFAQMKHGSTAQTTTSIIGIKTYLDNGLPSLLILDTTRANYYNPLTGVMTDVSSDLTTPANLFTGSASDFFHALNYKGVLYLTNNVDQIHQWTGRNSAVTPFNVQIDETDEKTNHVDTCQFMFVIDDRMVLLGTTEKGTYYPQRLRYAAVLQTDFTISGGGTDDAETQERICAAGKVGKTVYAFFQGPTGGSLWKIHRTGRTDTPLEWEQVTTTEGSRSPYSGIEFQDGLIAVGLRNIVFFDGFKITNVGLPLGNEQVGLESKVRDVLAEFNDHHIRKVFGHYRNEQGERHLLFTFADVDSSSVDRILDYNIPENNFTIHRSEQSFFINCFGGFNGQYVPTMSELDDALDDMGYSVSDPALVSEMTVDSRAVLGYPKPYTLIGCRNSKVYKWDDGEYDGTDDDDGKIKISAKTARLNPFMKNGRKAACEKIGFFVDNDANASFLVSVFKDTSSTAYKTKTISCNGANDKFWAWIFCDGEIGDLHRIEISHTAKGNTPKIHAMMPYFAPAGRLDI